MALAMKGQSVARRSLKLVFPHGGSAKMSFLAILFGLLPYWLAANVCAPGEGPTSQLEFIEDVVKQVSSQEPQTPPAAMSPDQSKKIVALFEAWKEYRRSKNLSSEALENLKESFKDSSVDFSKSFKLFDESGQTVSFGDELPNAVAEILSHYGRWPGVKEVAASMQPPSAVEDLELRQALGIENSDSRSLETILLEILEKSSSSPEEAIKLDQKRFAVKEIARRISAYRGRIRVMLGDELFNKWEKDVYRVSDRISEAVPRFAEMLDLEQQLNVLAGEGGVRFEPVVKTFRFKLKELMKAQGGVFEPSMVMLALRFDAKDVIRVEEIARAEEEIQRLQESQEKLSAAAARSSRYRFDSSVQDQITERVDYLSLLSGALLRGNSRAFEKQALKWQAEQFRRKGMAMPPTLVTVGGADEAPVRLTPQDQIKIDFGNGTQVSLTDLIRSADRYTEAGFVTPGEKAQSSVRWNDPLLERFRDRSKDYVDVPQEAYDKAQLVLSILSHSLGKPVTEIPIEYANLLLWTREELAYTSWIRNFIPDAVIGKVSLTDSKSSRKPLALTGELRRPNADLLRDQAQSVSQFYQHLSQVVGHSNVQIQFKDFEAFEQYRDRLMPLFERKSLLIPGPGLIQMGCILPDQKKGELQTESNWKWGEPMSDQRFSEVFEDRLGIDDQGDTSPFVVRDQNLLAQLFTQCLDKMTKGKSALVSELASSWEKGFADLKADRARDLSLLAVALDKALRKDTSPVPVISGTADEVFMQSIRLIQSIGEERLNLIFDELKKLLAAYPTDPELQKIRRLAESKFNQPDLEKIVSVGPLSFLQEVVKPPPQADVLSGLERLSVLEIDSLAILVRKFGWGSTPFDPEAMGRRQLRDWFIEFLPRGTPSQLAGKKILGLSSGDLRLLPSQSDAIQTASQELLDASQIVPLVWGPGWKEVAGEDLFELRKLADADLWRVMSLLAERQQIAMGLYPRLVTGAQFQPAKGLQSIQDLELGDVEQLKRFGIPVENAQLMSKLFDLSAKLIWRQVGQSYIKSLREEGVKSPSEIAAIEKDLARKDIDGPHPLVVRYFQSQMIKDRKEQSEFFSSQLGLPSQKLDDDQKAFAASTAEGLNQSVQQFVMSGLRSSDPMILDLLSQEDPSRMMDLQKAIQAIADPKLDPASRQRRFFEFIGFDTSSKSFRRALKLMRSNLEGDKDNGGLALDTDSLTDFEEEMDLEIQSFTKGVQALMKSFDQSRSGLSREDFKELLFLMKKDPLLKSQILGRDPATGQVIEGYEVKDLANPILKILGHQVSQKDMSFVKEQLTAFRRIARGVSTLFPGLEGTLAQALSMQMPTVLFESLGDRQLDSNLVQEILGRDFEAYSRSLPNEARGKLLSAIRSPVGMSQVFENRIEALDKLLLITSKEVPSFDSDSKRELAILLYRLDSSNSVNMDEFFTYLHLMLANREGLVEGLSEDSKADLRRKREAIEQKMRDLIPENLKAQSNSVFESLFAKLRTQSVIPDAKQVEELEILRQAAVGFASSDAQTFVSVYDERDAMQEEKDKLIMQFISSRLDSSLRDKDGEIGISGRKISFFPELFAQADREKDPNKKSILQLEAVLKLRNQIWAFLEQQNNDFFSTSQRQQSIAIVARQLFPKDYDVMLIEGQAEGLHSTIDALLKKINEGRLQLAAPEGPTLSSAHLIKLREWAQAEFSEALTKANEEERTALIYEGWMRFLRPEEIERFLRSELRIKDPGAYLDSPSLQIQLSRLQSEGSAFDAVLDQSAKTMLSMSRVSEKALWSKASALMLERLSQVNEFGLASGEVIRGISTLNAKRTEGLPDRLQADRYGSESKDSWGLWALHGVRGFGGEIGTLLWEGGKEAVAGLFGRMIGENVVINVPWALASVSDLILRTEIADDVFAKTTGFMGQYSWSNFHQDKLNRSSGYVAGDFAADFVGNTLTVMSFGGWSAVGGAANTLGRTTVASSARAGLNGVKSYVVRRAPRLAAGLERVSAGSTRILTREIGGLSRAARAELAAQQAIQRTSQQMMQSASRPGFGARVSATARAMKPQAKALGTRLLVDNAFLAVGGGIIQSSLMGGTSFDQFGQSMGHGIAFMSTLILSNFLLRGVPLANKTVHTALQNYIFRDFAKSSTIVMNNWLNPPDYMKYLSDDEIGDNGFPVASAWDDAPDPQAAAEAYMNDRMIKYQAYSGGLLIGLIGLAHVPQYALNSRYARGIARQVEGQGKGAGVLETLRGAYGSDPKRIYQELEVLEVKRIKETNAKAREEAQAKGASLPAELTEVQIRDLAKQSAQTKYYDFWLAAHPEQMFIRQIAFWEANGRLTDVQKSHMRSMIIDSYKKIYGEQQPLESLARSARNRGANEKSIPEIELKEVLRVFDESWDKGIALGQELKLLQATDWQKANASDVAKSVAYAFELLKRRIEKGEEVSPQSLKEALQEVAPAEFWESTSGQFVIGQVILPKMRALRNGASSAQLFGGVIGEATPAGRRIAELWESLEVSRKDGAAPAVGREVQLTERSDVSNLRVFSNLGKSEFSGMTYEKNGKTYAEINVSSAGEAGQVGRGLVIELPQGMGMGFLQNGQPYFTYRGQTFTAADTPGLLKLGERLNVNIQRSGAENISDYLISRLRPTRRASAGEALPAPGSGATDLVRVKQGEEWKAVSDPNIFFRGANPEVRVFETKARGPNGQETSTTIKVEESVSAELIRLQATPADSTVGAIRQRVQGKDTVETPALRIRWRQVPEAEGASSQKMPSVEVLSLSDGSSVVRLTNQNVKGQPQELWLPRGMTVVEGGPTNLVLSDAMGFRYELNFKTNEWRTFGERAEALRYWDRDVSTARKGSAKSQGEVPKRSPTIQEFREKIQEGSGLSPGELLITSGLMQQHREGNVSAAFESLKKKVTEAEVQSALQTLAPKQTSETVKEINPQEVQKKARDLRVDSRLSELEVEKFLTQTERQHSTLRMLSPRNMSVEDLVKGSDLDQLLRFTRLENTSNMGREVPANVRETLQKEFKSWTRDESFEVVRFLSELSPSDLMRMFSRPQLELAFRASERGRRLDELSRTIEESAAQSLKRSAFEKLGVDESEGPVKIKERAEVLVDKTMFEFREAILRGELSDFEIDLVASIMPRSALEALIDVNYLTRQERVYLGGHKLPESVWKLSDIPEVEVRKLSAIDFKEGLEKMSYPSLVRFAAQTGRMDQAFLQQHVTLASMKALMAGKSFEFKRDRLEVLMSEVQEIERALGLAMGR